MHLRGRVTFRLCKKQVFTVCVSEMVNVAQTVRNRKVKTVYELRVNSPDPRFKLNSSNYSNLIVYVLMKT